MSTPEYYTRSGTWPQIGDLVMINVGWTNQFGSLGIVVDVPDTHTGGAWVTIYVDGDIRQMNYTLLKKVS